MSHEAWVGLGTAGFWGIVLLGAYHGINPGMGWLFAVALGMQDQSSRGVQRALLPLGLGHGVAIGVVCIAFGLTQAVVPVRVVRIIVAVLLCGLGAYRLVRPRHPRWGGMQVGFRDLVVWSVLMASAHGAGLMLLPILMGGSASTSVPVLAAPLAMLTAVVSHTVGYVLITGLVAWLVYAKLGLALLRKAWVNLDLVWAVALIGTGLLSLTF